MTYIIAEIGVNHNGDLKLAKKLIDEAARAGADAAKFQIFVARNEIHPDTKMADYQEANTGKKQTMLEMVLPLELSFAQFRELKSHCDKREIDFLASVFDLDSLNFYADVLKCKTVKFGSGELNNDPLIIAAARKGMKIILSTGMATLKDIELALGVLAHGYTSSAKPCAKAFAAAYKSKKGQAALKKNVVIMQCTTNYPCPDEEINLNAMVTIARKFGVPVGFSDHSTGIGLACASVALGAVMYEKHFTFDKNAEGPDHKASLDLDELKQCVKEMRAVEKGLGSGKKTVTPDAAKIAKIACRNLVAWGNIKKGQKFTEKNLWSLRTNESGIDSSEYYNYIGKTADRDYKKNEIIRRTK